MRIPAAAAASPLLLLAGPTAAGCGAMKAAAVNTVASTLAETGTTFSATTTPSWSATLSRSRSSFTSRCSSRSRRTRTCSSPPAARSRSTATASSRRDAEALGEARHDEVVQLKARALRLYIRGKDYCLRAMDVRWKGMTARSSCATRRRRSAAPTAKDVPLLYWTAASWGAAASLGLDQPELVIDLPVVRALAERALALDENWSKGALHELMISIDSLPEALGGSPARAREHFEKAVKMQQGAVARAVRLARHGRLVPAQDRAGIRESCSRRRWRSTPRRIRSTSARDPHQASAARRALLDNIDAKFSKN